MSASPHDVGVATDVRRVLGRRVRSLRQTLGISQEELADRADLHRNYVSSVERGERDVGIVALGRLVTALGVSLSEFFDADGFPDPKRARGSDLGLPSVTVSPLIQSSSRSMPRHA